MQAMMTMNTLKVADAKTVIKAVHGHEQAEGAAARRVDDHQSAGGRPRRGSRRSAPRRTPRRRRRPSRRARRDYAEVCFACHGEDGRGEPLPGERREDTRARRSPRRRG